MEAHACEKFVDSINNIIELDKNLNEFGIIFTTVESDESAIFHVENKLGIASWCMKPLHRYVYSKLKEYKKNQHSMDTIEILKYSRVFLLIAPEIALVWNIRRRLFKKICNIKSECLLTHLVLTNKPKCLEAFNYRKWLTHQNLGSDDVNAADILNYIQTELQVSLQAANMNENNYHAWNHRLWCLNFVECKIKGDDLHELYLDEYQLMKIWVSVNVSQYSGMHYLLTVVDKLILTYNQTHFKPQSCNVNSPTELHLLLLEYNQKLIEDYSGHEALFHMRKGILFRLLKPSHETITDSNLKSKMIMEEYQFIIKIKQASDDYMEKNYTEWFKRVFATGLQINQ